MLIKKFSPPNGDLTWVILSDTEFWGYALLRILHGCFIFKKFMKHRTTPSTSFSVVSVFSRPGDYEQYKNYIINAASSGSVEIDGKGRCNIIWYANETTGETHKQGRASQKVEYVKLVLLEDDSIIHAYPT